MLSIAILVALVLVVMHAADHRAFIRLARGARPDWLFVAIALQAATYFFQTEVWNVVLRPAGARVRLTTMWKLTVARLAVDQALPSAGLSGTVLTAKALELRQVPRPVVMAAVVIDTASCYATYAVGAAAALVIVAAHHQASIVIVAGVAAFEVFALLITFGFLAMASRKPGPPAPWLVRLPPLRAGLGLLRQADPSLAHSPRLLVEACVCQAAVLVLDAATIWALIASLGATASPAGVFASFTMSTILRLVSVLPGGVGVFEAVSVLTLRMVGVDLAVSLSATSGA
jgi:Mg2+-importing ATPase